MRTQPSRCGGGAHQEWEEVFDAVSLTCSLGLCKLQEALRVTLGSHVYLWGGFVSFYDFPPRVTHLF